MCSHILYFFVLMLHTLHTVSVISIFVIKTELTIFATSDEAHRAAQFCAYMRLCAPNLCFVRTPTIATRRAIKRETTNVERTQYYPCISVAVASVSLVALYCRLALIACTFIRRQAVCDGVIRCREWLPAALSYSSPARRVITVLLIQGGARRGYW
jgi:hypothetical protein